jgi:hypothetical protein
MLCISTHSSNLNKAPLKRWGNKPYDTTRKQKEALKLGHLKPEFMVSITKPAVLKI